MTPDAKRAASELLYKTWMAGDVIEALPASMRPTTRSEGYEVQALLERKLGSLFGWKIAATSLAGQNHINVDGPLAGRIFASRVFGDGAIIPFGANRMAVAEAEFAFRMARDLPPRDAEYSVDDVLDAVASVHVGIEVPDSRYADFITVGAAQLIADNACAHYFLAAPSTGTDWRRLDLAAHPVIARVEGKFERHGVGANALGDPRVALAWLVNELSRSGVTLRAGEMVTTGTCVQPLEIAPGDRVTVDLGIIGKASVSFGA
ncbi:MAG: hydratase [Beijerinckiaceae bacterium]